MWCLLGGILLVLKISLESRWTVNLCHSVKGRFCDTILGCVEYTFQSLKRLISGLWEGNEKDNKNQ